MRKALNENPMVQVAVLAVVAIAFAFILFTSVLKKEEPPPSATEPVAASSTATPETATPDSTPATVAPTDAPVAPAAPEPSSAAPTGGGSVTDGLLPSKGLPKELLVAFAKNKTIALLVIDPKGISDKQVEAYTKALRSRGDVAVFIADVADIADYSRVTAGVSVSRVPALVVIRPRKLTGSVPTATVSYGFRGGRSVNQAIDDSLYEGKQVGAYP